MELKPNMNPNFSLAPGAPQAPPMYPTIENQYPPPTLPPIMFFNGQPTEQNHYQPATIPLQTTGQPGVPESRPSSFFILNGKTPVGPDPLRMNCPHCNIYQTSKVVSRVSLKTHFAALICCVLGLVCLVPIPYCMNAFKNMHHYCNNCGQYLGSYPAK